MAKESTEKDVDQNWTVKKVFVKALKSNAKWEDKDELLDVLYWGRQIFSLILGICWGIIPLKGLLAMAFYVISSTVGGHCYIINYQKQDEEQFGGFMEIAKEGFGAAFATFMVSWIVIYSALHFDE